MYLLKNVRSFCGVLSAVVLLVSCSTATFPDIIEDDQANVGGEITEQSSDSKIVKKMPEEGNSLKADTKNAAYEGDEDEDDVEISSEVDELLSDDAAKSNDEETVLKENGKPAPKLEDVLEEDKSPSVTYRLETIYFENGSAVVDSSYNAKLREIVKEAKAKDATLRVLGYASSRTRNTDIVSHKLANFKVSTDRAQNVAAALKKAGMPADKISIEALSDTAPAYLEVMPEGERLNRRAEIYISY